MRKKTTCGVQTDCVACGTCMKVCPRQAISIYKGIRAMVDPNQCVGCGLCKKECPANAIVIEEKVYEETLV